MCQLMFPSVMSREQEWEACVDVPSVLMSGVYSVSADVACGHVKTTKVGSMS